MRLKSPEEVESLKAFFLILGVMILLGSTALAGPRQRWIGFLLGAAFSAFSDRLADLILEDDNDGRQ
jgi:hypothetical protein